ncbi:hypothetical protein [Pseudomonas sp. G5(2012)]|uniref:Uncharacterized protein n=1 Tax=Pseudomonas sp. OPS1 TaxID=179973 RepID=Q8KKE9_9PSED|nr:hypothetical protein [Pseudomonas sp. G5(2012)]AAM21268.1 unknown [Pseudomonas sp. OPS1]
MSTRRGFLIGSAQVSALAMLTPTGLFAMPALTSPPIVLGCGLWGEEKFVASLGSRLAMYGQPAPEQVALNATQLRSPNQISALLKSLQGRRLVGYLDSSSVLILTQLLHGQGGEIWLEGDHAVAATGLSRHHFTSTPSSAGIGQSLAASLDRSGQPYTVEVRQIGLASESRLAAPSVSATHWATALGSHYADILSERWNARDDAPKHGGTTDNNTQFARLASTFIAKL